MNDFSHIQRPDAVFWDWDGTLADSYSFLNEAHNYTLQTLGFPKFKDGEYKNYFGKPREILYRAIYKDKCDEAKEIFGDYVIKNAHKIKTIDGCESVLDHFYNLNTPMGIVSNKRSDLIAEEIKHLGWERYFISIIGAGDADEDKPSAAPLMLALQNSDICHKTKNLWFIGDTENDLACANKIGCHSVFLKGHNNPDVLIQKYNPLIVFDNYSQLKHILVAI